MKALVVMNGPADDDERSIHARRLPALLGGIRDRGVDVAVALLGDAGGLRADLAHASVPVAVIPTAMPPSAAGLRALRAAVRGLRPIINTFQPDLIEGDEPMPCLTAALAARPRSGVVLVYKRHHHSGRRRLIIASRLAAHLADRTVVSNVVMKAVAARDDRTRPDRILVAPSGVTEPRPVGDIEIEQARRSLGIGSQDRVIAAVSRLRWEKGLDVLLRALDRLGVDGVHVVVAGGGPEEEHLRTLAASVRVPVHLLGYQDDVALWMAVADVIAIPSRREAFGRTTLEAMAAGRPIVGTCVGGLTEAIADGETGILVPPDDPDAFFEALTTVLHDHELARAMGVAARRRYEEHYTIDDMANSWLATWEAALNVRAGDQGAAR